MKRRVTEFDPKVCETIGVYVYALRDPASGEVFYVGKGVGNRCFAHVEEARENQRGTEKLERIRAILDRGKDVGIDIVRHGLDEATALEVEAALIDVLGLTDFGNLVRGHGIDRGLVPAQELQIHYGAKELESDEPLLLIKINRLYEPGMSLEEVYEAARCCWRMDICRARKVEYLLAVANGIVRGVFRPLEFHRVTQELATTEREAGRVYFDAVVVEDSPYLWCSTREFGQRSEIRYLNC